MWFMAHLNIMGNTVDDGMHSELKSFADIILHRVHEGIFRCKLRFFSKLQEILTD